MKLILKLFCKAQFYKIYYLFLIFISVTFFCDNLHITLFYYFIFARNPCLKSKIYLFLLFILELLLLMPFFNRGSPMHTTGLQNKTTPCIILYSEVLMLQKSHVLWLNIYFTDGCPQAFAYGRYAYSEGISEGMHTLLMTNATILA